ncbi:MAG TPA: hypothetical protein VL282_05540 [Tepidisphaeraceae bacterium]|jgi:hypothetical protein|nr:hypothetical protein [Tepidisphaeraceae bacterium]
MQHHKPILELAQLAVREKICPICAHRPHGSETLGPTVARSCEPACTIFLNLAQMLRAAGLADPAASPDEVLRNYVCPACRASLSAGDYCAEHLARTCPLSCYSAEVLEILQRLKHAAGVGTPMG